MWFELLPAMGIICGAMMLPHFVMPVIHRLLIDNTFTRNMDQRFDRVMYQRDRRLTDNPYIQNLLDDMPDPSME